METNIPTCIEAVCDATLSGLKNPVIDTQGRPVLRANPGLWDRTPLGFQGKRAWKSEPET
jgi:hypothetical protein